MEECVPTVMDEGKSHEQAVAQCSSMWDERMASGAAPSRETQEPSSEPSPAEDPAPEPSPDSREKSSESPSSAPGLEAAIARLDAFRESLDAFEGRVSGDPAPPRLRNADDILRYFEERNRESQKRVLSLARAYIDKKRGVVPEGASARQKMHAEIDAVLAEVRNSASNDVPIGEIVERERKKLRDQIESDQNLRDEVTVQKLRRLQDEITALRNDESIRRELEAIRAKARESKVSVDVDGLIDGFEQKLDRIARRFKAAINTEAARRAEESLNG